MNQQYLSLTLLLAAVSAGAQTPAAPPAPSPNAAQATVSSRISRYVAGPGDRPQGFLLRNGTFVTLSLGLAQRMPASLNNNASVQVAGDAFSYDGNRTIQARTITIGGISYADDAPPIPGDANGAGPAGGPPPPPPGRRGGPPIAPPQPCNAAAPTPPPGVGPGGVPPAPGAAGPPPPPPGGAAPPPLAPDNAAPPPPPTPDVAAPAPRPAPQGI